tara:strand:+ start:1071 stop:1868 length:798 start_codon:yes stop_codon:yes gene_type:complete
MELLPNERGYKKIAHDILHNGSYRKTRNGHVRSLPNQILKITGLDHGVFPIITTRYIHWPGILGEYAALIRGPKNVEDFERWGCNYWSYLGDQNGNLNLDYGNLWIDADGRNQMQEVANDLRNNPTSRRMVISGWNPGKQNDLSLPCCHYSYQFWRNDDYVDLLWTQRSGDWMVGIPSDMVLAATMLSCFASYCRIKPRNITMIIGDAHIYEDHFDIAKVQLDKVWWEPPKFRLKKQWDIQGFKPEDLGIFEYRHRGKLSYVFKP